MACKPSCGSDRAIVEMLIESAITKALKDGTLQGALKDCEGGALSAGTKVVLCASLAATVNSLIKSGEIDIVTGVDISDGKLVVTNGDGTKKEVALQTVKSVEIKNGQLVVTNADGSKDTTDLPIGTSDLAFDSATNKLSWMENNKYHATTLPYAKVTVGTSEVVITDANGNTVAVPKAGNTITGDDFDTTITKGANVANKYGVKLGKGLEAGLNGISVKLGDGLTTDAAGNVIVNNNVAPATMTDITNGTYKLGFHTFSGSSASTSGLPLDIHSEDNEQGSFTGTSTQAYDYNGYYIASNGQVDVWLQGTEGTAWFIMNDHGLNADGTLKNPAAWGKWQKLDNSSSVTNEMVKKMQEQINNLASQITTNNAKDVEQDNRLAALEAADEETCKVPIRTVTGDYTVVDDDNTIIVNSASAVSITVPSNIPTGRMYTVIQGGAGTVTLKGGAGVTLLSPYEGSLVLAGQKAAVTVLKTDTSQARVFGQTEAA